MGYFDDLIPGNKKDEPKSEYYEAGRALPGAVQGLFSGMQGPTLGFADEIGGLGGAIAGGVANLVGKDDGTSFVQRYKAVRDAIRGATEAQEKENPYLTAGTRLAAGAPLMLVGGGSTALPTALGVGRQAGQAAMVAGGLGTLQGLGESKAEDVGGMLADAARSGATSAALGGGATAAMAGVGGALGAVRRAVSNPEARNFARLKVAEAVARDNPRNPIALDDLRGVLQELGPEGRIADAAGASTRGLLDTVAIMPGESKQAVEAAIRARQVGRGGRIVNAADDALGTGGRRFIDEVDALRSAKSAESFPFYDQIRWHPVEQTDELRSILQRVTPRAWQDAREIARAEWGQNLNPAQILKSGEAIPLSYLDSVKKALYASAENLAQGRKGDVAAPLHGVRRDLIEYLDKVSPRTPEGTSIYRLARETYGGFASLEDALQAGRKAMTEDAVGLADLVRGLSATDLHSFRIGALQALRQKAGTEGGQTSLLKAYKEPATQERLKLIFGDSLPQFMGALEREGRLKAFESIGRGSQTAPRLAAMDDLGLNPTKPTGRGMISAAGDALGRAWQRMSVPEETRNEIGRLLLSQGQAGEDTVNMLRMYLNAVNDARMRRAAAAGAFAGYAPSF